MSVDQTPQTSGVERRSIVKGAAWAMPVVAAAVAVPSLATSSAPSNWDVKVTATCANNYDLTALKNILDKFTTVLYPTSVVMPLVEGVLGAPPLNLKSGAARYFTITANEGTIPAGTQFTLSNPGLIDLSVLQTLINAQANVAGLVTVGSGGIITLNQALTPGTSIKVDLWNSLLDVGALSTISLTLTNPTNDNPSVPTNAGPNAASISSVVGAAVDLGKLKIKIKVLGVTTNISLSDLLGLSGMLAVQVCGTK